MKAFIPELEEGKIEFGLGPCESELEIEKFIQNCLTFLTEKDLL